MSADRPRSKRTTSGLLLTAPLLLVAAFGPLLTFEDSAWSVPVIAAWLGSGTAAVVLCMRCRVIDEASLWIWVFVFLFTVGYFGKTFFVYGWLNGENDLAGLSPEWVWIGYAELTQAYVWSCGAFVVFVVALLFVRPGKALDDHPMALSGRRTRVALVLCALLVCILAVARAAFGIGAAQVIVGLSNAVSGLVAAAYFPMSLTLGTWLRQPGGLTRYCVRIAFTVGMAAAVVAAVLGVSPLVCRGHGLPCPSEAIWTAALVLAGAGLRLGALGTQHAGAFLHKPHANLASATAEAVIVIAVLVLAAESLGLLGLGVAIVGGGLVRLTVALVIERQLLLRSASPRGW